MDRRERFSDLTLLLRSALQGWQSSIWTALPGTYQAAGSKVGTANVQPTVQVQLIDPVTNQWGSSINLPLCLDCPVLWPGAGGAHATFPLAAGNEGLIVFASRCIDNWWLSGGPQAQAEYRMHDLSDGFFIPGCFSQANAPSAPWSTTTARLTSDDGLCYLELDPVNHALNLVAPGGISFNGVPATFPGGGAIRFGGALQSTGEVTAKAGGASSVGLTTHTTTGVSTGAGVSTAPTPGS
jgi:hypothetical protein